MYARGTIENLPRNEVSIHNQFKILNDNCNQLNMKLTNSTYSNSQHKGRLHLVLNDVLDMKKVQLKQYSSLQRRL